MRPVPVFRRWILRLVVLLLGVTPAAALVSSQPAAAQTWPNSMDALGDSFTLGFGAAGGAADSYSTGTNPLVNSLYLRILTRNTAIAGNNFNDAAPGSTMSALNGQMGSAVSRNVDFVTVLLGLGDICLAGTEAGMTPVADYRASFERGMNTFSSGLPSSRVLVVSVPDLYRVWEVLKDDPAARDAWSQRSICPAMFENPLSTDQADVDRRTRVRQRIIDYNTQLQQVCALHAGCFFDDNTMFNLALEASDFSTSDYFHPSTQWHTKVAAALWPFVEQSAQIRVTRLTALSDAHLWIGVKSSGDQGSRFDVKVELLKNGTPVASGLQRCISRLRSNPSQAKETIVVWDPFTPVGLRTGDVVALRVSVRVGTKPNDTRCGGSASALGLRLYYDATSSASRFDATINPDPSTDQYLHSDGTACTNTESAGVTTRYVDSTPPSATSAKCKDSASINFAGGNPFQVIGTWSRAPQA